MAYSFRYFCKSKLTHLKKILFLFFLITSLLSFSQGKKIKIIRADYSEADDTKYPGAIVLSGNVKISHEGATLDSNFALLYRDKNLFKAIGEVVIEQGDSIIQYSDFVNYDGNTKIAKSWGNVEANDKEMKLTTDTLYFDRKKQILYYPNWGTIRDKKNTLKSIRGSYYTKTKKFEARTKVSVLNPENNLETNNLDYYTDTRLAYLYGPSTVTNLKDSTKIYAERGFHNTNTNVSYFVKNSKLFLKDRTVFADSMYYDKRKGFASATNRIKVIDTLNNMVTKGNYAEIFEEKDSLFIVKKAVGITVKDKDSTFIHGDTIMVTGKPEKRIIRTFHNVKIFKSDLQGKCDSTHTSQATGLTKMYRNPVLWSGKSQITGDSIQILNNTKTEKLDSLFIYGNAFMIQKDSISGKLFNQIKGRDMFGKFKENELRILLVKGNAESIYFNRNEKTQKLETVTKQISSDIEFVLENNEIYETKYFKVPEGKTYPPSEFPKDLEKLKGFIWREDEQPKTKNDIFIKSNTNKLPQVKKGSSTTNAIEKVKNNFTKESTKKKQSKLKESFNLKKE